MKLVRVKVYDSDCKYWVIDKFLPSGEIMTYSILGLDESHFGHRVFGSGFDDFKECLPKHD